jgi:hypothetical protein
MKTMSLLNYYCRFYCFYTRTSLFSHQGLVEKASEKLYFKTKSAIISSNYLNLNRFTLYVLPINCLTLMVKVQLPRFYVSLDTENSFSMVMIRRSQFSRFLLNTSQIMFIAVSFAIISFSVDLSLQIHR